MRLATRKLHFLLDESIPSPQKSPLPALTKFSRVRNHMEKNKDILSDSSLHKIIYHKQKKEHTTLQ